MDRVVFDANGLAHSIEQFGGVVGAVIWCGFRDDPNFGVAGIDACIFAGENCVSGSGVGVRCAVHCFFLLLARFRQFCWMCILEQLFLIVKGEILR